MAEYLPKFYDGDPFTCQVGAKVTGGQLVEVSGDNTVQPAAAASDSVIGVAGFDAEVGDTVTVFPGGVQRPIASGAIAAGDRVAAAAAGKVSTAEAATIGTALAAAADGERADIKFDH
ncbi:capsid cement protein [Brevibacterium aurantiacum]|uniref:capsid cement protein n=1 Tax=Brevibacterium aurantiacum TaxID=273384 RepID=UPI003F91D729